MRKIYSTTILAFCMNFLMAQEKGIYINIQGGSAFPGLVKTNPIKGFVPGVNPDPAYSQILDMTNSSDSGKYSSKVLGSYASGGNLNLTLGYMVNPYLGVEMGFTYLFGNTITSKNISSSNPLLGNNSVLTTKTWSNGGSLMPGIRLRAAKPEWKVYPYARLGLVIPIFGMTYHSLHIDAPNATILSPLTHNATADLKIQTKSTVSIGFSGSIGIGYQPLKWMSVFAEMNAQYLHVRAKSTSITQYNVNAELRPAFANPNQLDAITGAAKTKYSQDIVYVDKLDASSNTTLFGKQRGVTTPVAGVDYVDESKARNDLRISSVFDAVGVAVGVSFFIPNSKICNSSKKVKEVN